MENATNLKSGIHEAQVAMILESPRLQADAPFRLLGRLSLQQSTLPFTAIA